MEKEIDYKWNLSENEHHTILNAQKRREVIRSSYKKYSHPYYRACPLSTTHFHLN
jgi:hypothetical protein